MGRRNQLDSNPYAQPDSGRKFYREPGEPVDDRPTIRREPFWDSPEEESAYLSAVRNNPQKVGESPLSYIVRIAETVQRGPLPKPAKPFPPAPNLDREYSGPRPTVTEGGLTFEDRLDAIYAREPGEDG